MYKFTYEKDGQKHTAQFQSYDFYMRALKRAKEVLGLKILSSDKKE